MEYTPDNRLTELLTGKRVVLVGPARTLMGKGMGRAISEHDVVCRVNEVFPFGWTEDYGNRTDIMFHSFGGGTIALLKRALKRNPWVSQWLKFMVCPSLGSNQHENRAAHWTDINRDPLVYHRRHQIPFHHCGDAWWHHWTAEVGAVPSTGYLAMLCLLQYPLAELTVTGMTFFREGNDVAPTHYPGYLKWGGDTHKVQSFQNPHDMAQQTDHFIRKVVPEYSPLLRLGDDVASSVGLTSNDVRTWQPSPSPLPPNVLLGLTRGKRVALVGPAPYLQGAGIGPEIDGYDVVCRVNQTELGGQEADYGSRTDVVFHAPNAVISRQKSRITVEYASDIVTYCELAREIGWSANTGMLAIADLLRQEPAELFITGMDFYQSGQSACRRHSKGYLSACDPTQLEDEGVSAQSGRHNQEPQRRWLADKCRENPDRIRTDAALASILREPRVATGTKVRAPVYAVYRAFYGQDFIRQSIESVKPWVDRVFVFWTDKAFADVRGIEWDGEWVEFKRDRVKDIAEDCGATVLFDHYGTPEGQWSHLINDRILAEYQRPEIIICMEPDMVWESDTLQGAIIHARECKTRSVFGIPQVEHWRHWEHFIERTNGPRIGPVIYRMDGETVGDTGKSALPKSGDHFQGGIVCHNLGFCVSAQSMLTKHLTALAFSAAIGDSLPDPNWYAEKWLTWTPATRDLEPSAAHAHFIPKAEPYEGPIPEVLNGA